MALDWTNKTNGENGDFILAEDVNSLAAAIIDNEGDIAELQSDGETLSGKIESLESGIADVLDYLEAHRYDAFPTETQTGKALINTDIGADNAPLKSISVDVASVAAGDDEITLRQCGKNLCQMDGSSTETEKVASYRVEISSSDYSSIYAYRFTLPPGHYVFSSTLKNEGDAGGNISVRINNNNAFVSPASRNAKDSNGNTITDNYARIVYGGSTLWYSMDVQDGDYLFFFVSSSASKATVQTNLGRYKIQAEIGSAKTDYVNYVQTDYQIAVSGAGTYTPTGVTTTKGDNNFFVVQQSGLSASVDATYRIDPTLAYEKLKAAVIAAGN